VKIGPVPGVSGAGVSFGVTAAKALEQGALDGFWANGMGAEVAVRNGIGTVVVDARRDGPPAARGYTFPAFVTTQKKIDEQPEVVAAAVRAIVGAQAALKEDPERATAVGKKLFPPTEAGLIAELVRRDAPFYDPAISWSTVDAVNRFAREIGILTKPVPYEQVVAERFRGLWSA
jgi:NitT/TauT family transport system substrate-binding protein